MAFSKLRVLQSKLGIIAIAFAVLCFGYATVSARKPTVPSQVSSGQVTKQQNSATPNLTPKNSVRPLIENYCGKCHTGDKPEGGFLLTELDGIKTDSEVAKRWEEVANALQDDYMPPEEAPQPTDDEKQQVIEWVKSNVMVEKEHSLLRRMNQVEYENTIRDLFVLGRDGFANTSKILKIDEYFQPEKKLMPRYVFAISHYAFPDEQRPELLQVTAPPIDLPAEHGYTNDGKSLQFTSLLLQKYLQLGREIVASPTLPAIAETWKPLFVATDRELDREGMTQQAAAIELAEERLASFLARAFRREVTDDEVAAFVKVFAENFSESNSFTESMQATVAAALVSPDFLFLFQAPELGLSTKQRQSFVNASRLSYFLWASMPDETLLGLANSGDLVTKEQVLQQAQRMMKDKKVKSLATDFGMQWLKVNRLLSSFPDKDKFKRFYARRKQPIGVAMAIEQLLLFETIMVEDQSILKFVDADFTYVNRDLLYWYGYDPETYVGYTPRQQAPFDFFRIKLPKDQHRGGAIVSGATLVLTSTSTRSSPVFRGAWVSETIFNRPPPPPPANVPALEKIETDDTGKILNVREKLAIHRQDPNCSSCHSRIDPLGFGLEQFDAVGKRRWKYENGEPIDSQSEFEGDRFANALGLKRMILRKQDVFVKAFVEHLIRYAINRELTLADDAEVERITEAVIADDCRFHAVVEHLVTSPIFLSR